MLSNILNEKSNEINQYASNKAKLQNYNKQIKIDDGLSQIVNEYELMFNLIYTSYKYLKFKVDAQTLNYYISELSELKITMVNNDISLEQFESLKKSMQSLKNICKSTWNKHYKITTTSTLNLLEIIKSTNPDKINTCIYNIKRGDVWFSNDNEIIKFSKNLNESNQLIDDLNIDNDIIEFMKKLNKGTASIADLSEKIINWIKEEKLENKIKLVIK